jgi:hypothetical protein
MAFRAVVLVVIMAGLGCGILSVSCNQNKAKSEVRTVPERVSVAPGCLASGKHCFALNVNFTSAKPSGSTDNVARLGFAVDDGKSDPKAMELSNPAHPQGALEVFDSCEVEMEPRLTQGVVTSENDQEYRADATYWFEVFSPSKEPVADFTIDENANLSIISGSVKKPFNVQLVSTRGRSIYIVYRVAPVTSKSTPLFAFEWIPEDIYAKHSIKAADGWRYEFYGHNGKLGFYHASCMGTLPDDLSLVATAEQEGSVEELRAWVKAEDSRRQSGSCRTSGG